MLAADLEPATLYFYMVGNPILGLSNLFNFTTGPELGEGYPLRFGVLADVGMTYNSSTTVEHLMTNDPDLVLLIGDYTYADDHQTNGKDLCSLLKAFQLAVVPTSMMALLLLT